MTIKAYFIVTFLIFIISNGIVEIDETLNNNDEYSIINTDKKN